MKTIPKSISVTASTQEADQIRLQRLIQQRKRMEYMSALINQQRDSISILKQENHQLSQSYCDIKLQNQLLKDKLDVSGKYNENISQVLVKQSSLLQSFRQLLLGTNLHISQQQRQILLQQIQSSYQKWQTFNRTQIPSPKINFNYTQNRSKYSKLDIQAAQQISRLTDQNQQLNEKYQQLCKNYLQLSKDIKLKQLQIANLSNGQSHHKHHKDDSSHHNCGHIRQKKSRTPTKNQNNSLQINNPDQALFYQRIIKEKDSQILLLTERIQQLKIQQQRKDQLIKQHRKNQKQQKKLLHFLKTKFNLQGKQLSQIVSHNRIKSTIHLDASPNKILMDSIIDKNQFQSSIKKMSQKSPQKQQSSNAKYRNQNYETSNVEDNKNYVSNKKDQSSLKINEANSAGFKKTLFKNQNDL